MSRTTFPRHAAGGVSPRTMGGGSRLFRNSPLGIYWTTAADELLLVNPALARMLGWSVSELLAAGHSAAFHRDPATPARLLEEYRNSRRIHACVEWRRKDGALLWVQLTGWPAESPMEGWNYIEIVAEDITERRERESRLAQAPADESIWRIAGGIAHDFNNRIGAIIGWADLGIEETPPGSLAKRHFERIRSQAANAAALAHRLLAYARREDFEPPRAAAHELATPPLSSARRRVGESASPSSASDGKRPVPLEPPRDLAPTEGGTETILVVEDHDGLRQLARKTLSSLGYRVLVTADGEQALRMLESHPHEIALVLVDVRLPGMSGMEVWTRIHAMNPHLPVIFTTGCAPDLALLAETCPRGLRMIQKPYTTRELARQVRAALGPRPQAIKVDTPT